MTVTQNTESSPNDSDELSGEPDRFDRVAVAITELHGEIQEMRRDLRKLANQLLAGLVDLAKE